jgi:DNA-binding XRE family transcriptional regulator
MVEFSKKSHEQLINKWRQNAEFVKAYEELEEEFALLDEAIKARKEQKLTQTEVALRMGVPRSAVCRLERGLVSGKMPSLPTLKRYAKAIGKKVEIRLI